jgi:heme-binding NEAT domain protein
MIEKLKRWFNERFSDTDAPSVRSVRPDVSQRFAQVRQPGNVSHKESQPNTTDSSPVAGTPENANANNKVLIRNKFVRENTGTHETLTILDDSMVDSGEQTGIDPYNTGAFDRSKNWERRSRK